MKETTRYLNTDLDLIAEQDLTLLVQALETGGFYALSALALDVYISLYPCESDNIAKSVL